MQVQNPEVGEIIRDQAGLTLTEGFPQSLSSSITSVIDITPHFHKVMSSINDTGTTSGTRTVFTASTSKKTYIVGFHYSYIKDATCDITTGAGIAVRAVSGGATRTLAAFTVLTTTAQSESIFIQLPRPILMDRGGAVSHTGTYTAGTLVRSLTVHYYEE